jgi:hypothetical protein
MRCEESAGSEYGFCDGLMGTWHWTFGFRKLFGMSITAEWLSAYQRMPLLHRVIKLSRSNIGSPENNLGGRFASFSSCLLRFAAISLCLLQFASFNLCLIRFASFSLCLLRFAAFSLCLLRFASFSLCLLRIASFSLCLLRFACREVLAFVFPHDRVTSQNHIDASDGKIRKIDLCLYNLLVAYAI